MPVESQLQRSNEQMCETRQSGEERPHWTSTCQKSVLRLLALFFFCPPSSSISCGDLSFPAGPTLISYWSSELKSARWGKWGDTDGRGPELGGSLGLSQDQPLPPRLSTFFFSFSLLTPHHQEINVSVRAKTFSVFFLTGASAARTRLHICGFEEGRED